jgi:hypothetical protein
MVPQEISKVMIQQELLGQVLPSDWNGYLDLCLTIENKLKSSNAIYQNPYQLKSNTSKDVKTVSTQQTTEPMTQEQINWYNNGSCWQCGNHKNIRGQACKKPKYTGWYELPKRTFPDKGKERTHQIEEQPAESASSTTGATISQIDDNIISRIKEILGPQVTPEIINKVALQADTLNTTSARFNDALTTIIKGIKFEQNPPPKPTTTMRKWGLLDYKDQLSAAEDAKIPTIDYEDFSIADM